MARPPKKGLDFFPLDVNFLDDIKVRRIMSACGTNSIVVLICLLSNIYRDEGYYMAWNKDISFLIADKVGVKEGLVSEVLTKALQVGFFDESMFDNYEIITSKGIQDRYFFATGKRVNNHIVEQYLLINDEESTVNVTETIVNSTETPVKGDISTQKKRKGKERKVKERKVNNNKQNNKPTYNSIIKSYTNNSDLQKALLDFVEFRKTDKTKIFSIQSLKYNLTTLSKLADDDNIKLQIVSNTVANGWKGFYPLKDNRYQANNQFSGAVPGNKLGSEWDEVVKRGL